MSDDDLIDQLRRAASIWFKNSDLLLLEEFIRRFNRLRKPKPMSLLSKLLKDLEWRGPNGSMLGHIVLTREEAQALLFNVGVKLTPEQASSPQRPMGIKEDPPITKKDLT